MTAQDTTNHDEEAEYQKSCELLYGNGTPMHQRLVTSWWSLKRARYDVEELLRSLDEDPDTIEEFLDHPERFSLHLTKKVNPK